METTIRLSGNVKKQLDKMKIHSKESYSDVIEFLIEDHLELSEETKRRIKKAKKSENWISHEEVKKRFGL